MAIGSPINCLMSNKTLLKKTTSNKEQRDGNGRIVAGGNLIPILRLLSLHILKIRLS